MSSSRLCLRVSFIAVATAAPTVASAFVLPSFHLSTCAGRATHIVVVTEGDEVDGKVEVLESWLGDLRKGQAVEVPALASAASPAARKLLDQRQKPLPFEATGRRLLLFLIRTEEGWLGANTVYGTAWGMDVSSVWIERGKGYAFVQVQMSGPQVLYQVGDERSIRAEVLGVIEERRRLVRSDEDPDAARRARTLSELVRSKNYEVCRAAGERLARVESDAVGHLRSALMHPDAPSHTALVVLDHLSSRDAEAAVTDSIRLLDRELEECDRRTRRTEKGLVVDLPMDRLQRSAYVLEWMERRRLPAFADAAGRVAAFWADRRDTAGLSRSLRSTAERAEKACRP